jgi:threonine aldolase
MRVMALIDMRSDTVTMPTPDMRQAMATAPLGDDVFGDDPMVNQLEELASVMMGKEASAFIPSGTMGNVLGIVVNARLGEELIADADSHVFLYEGGGAASIAGVQVRPIATDAGVMSPGQIRDVVRPRDDYHQPLTAAISFEDTHNRHGGVVWPLADLQAAAAEARQLGLRVHLDGARLFNAAVASGVDVKELAACGDTLTFCLSKGLSCPAGSMFCGERDAVDEARRWRKRLGGAMRQPGVLAACGVIALETLVDRLAEDHANARTLAEGLAELPGIECDLSRVQTNIVYFDVKGMAAQAFEDACKERGLLGGATSAQRVRLVTHRGIGVADVQSALAICEQVLSA